MLWIATHMYTSLWSFLMAGIFLIKRKHQQDVAYLVIQKITFLILWIKK